MDRDRTEAIREVLQEYEPDILVLNEALFCQEFGGKAVKYGELLGFGFEAAALYDEEWGNAVLSRHKITNHREMRIYNRGGLIVEIETPQGRCTVASYHPHPRRHAENKAFDFAELVKDISGPLIVCGDLNCVSPEDAFDRAKLTEAFAAFSNEPEAVLNRFVESGRKVFSALGAFGLQDAVPPHKRRYTIPTDLLNTDKTSAIRIDHILANAEVSVLDGEIIQSAATNRASDHHPVMISFDLRSDGGSPD